jgi:YD repeat-containing protein
LEVLAHVLGTNRLPVASWNGLTPPPGGFSFADLQQMGEQAGIHLLAVERARQEGLPVPSIVHWPWGHFAALLERRGDRVLVNDPGLGGESWWEASRVESGASGDFLVPGVERFAPGRELTAAESALIRGLLVTNGPAINDDTDESCPTDEQASDIPVDSSSVATPDIVPCPPVEKCPPGQGTNGCGGMPTWRVSEPFINLWVTDIPLYYTMSNGRIFPFVLRYKQRNAAHPTSAFGVGNSWECSWRQYVENRTNDAYMRVAGGGRRIYTGLNMGWFIRDPRWSHLQWLMILQSPAYKLYLRSRCTLTMTQQLTNNFTNPQPADYPKARLRHWLLDGDYLGTQMGMERSPSPDGTTLGHKVWYAYDYGGGTNRLWPTLAAERLPDDSVRYTQWARNDWGRPTNIVATYQNGVTNGPRTYAFLYDTNTQLNLLKAWGPETNAGGNLILTRQYGYNTNNQVISFTNALNEVTTYAYSANRNLSRRQWGQTLTCDN